MTHQPRQTSRPASSMNPPHHHHVPPGTGTFGMMLFLLSLAMLFGASMLVYIVFRLTAPGPPLGSLDIPASLWISTAVILVSSYTIHRALQNVRHERQTAFRNMMVITLLLAVGFLIVQAPSLAGLYQQHRQADVTYQQELEAYRDAIQAQRDAGFIADETTMPDRPALPLYGLVMFLILIHALHILGGLVPLAVVTTKAHAGRYDHESHAPVQHVAMYWHFLDAVWVIMFTVFLLAA